MSRRGALSGVASVGLSLPLLSACGGDGDAAGDGDATSGPAPSTSEPTSKPTSEPTSGGPSEEPSSSQPPAADGIAATRDVPVGGGLVVADEEVVITQPTRGEFKVFTAVCTHEQCLVAEVDVTINCPCHKSKYDIRTGEPTSGPAPSALDPVDFQISGDQVVLS